MPDNMIYHFGQQGKIVRGRLISGGVVRAILVHIAVVCMFGVFLPWWLGFQFLDPVTIAAYSCLGVIFAAPAAAQAFAGDRPNSTGEALARIGVTVLYGETMAVAILLAGLITIVMTHPQVVIPRDFGSFAEAIALGLSGSLAMASIAAWLGLRLSAGAARITLRLIFLSLLLLFFFRSRWLPDVKITGTLVCLAIAAVAMFGVSRMAASSSSPKD